MSIWESLEPAGADSMLADLLIVARAIHAAISPRDLIVALDVTRRVMERDRFVRDAAFWNDAQAELRSAITDPRSCSRLPEIARQVNEATGLDSVTSLCVRRIFEAHTALRTPHASPG